MSNYPFSEIQSRLGTLTQQDVEHAFRLLYAEDELPLVLLPPKLRYLTSEDWALLQAMLCELLREREENVLH